MGIQFRQVSYHYPSDSIRSYQAISDISLKISAKDEFIAIVGHTGSGKSTLAQHMNALIFPTSGTVEIFGSIIGQRRDKKVKYNSLRRRVGLVFQFPEYQLFEETVEKDIMFGPLNFKVSQEKAKRLASEAIKLVGLDETYLHRNPFNLSGGEKRRVSIAGILALDPEILVLDEPTSGLDPQGKKQMMKLFNEIREETGKTIILITHDMDLVYEYMTRVIVLNDGILVFDGDPDSLFRRHDLEKYHLNYPETINILKKVKDRFGLDIDIYQKDASGAASEIRRVIEK